MKKDVFITGLASFFPNSPVSNDEMEEFLGLISGKHSKRLSGCTVQNGSLPSSISGWVGPVC